MRSTLAIALGLAAVLFLAPLTVAPARGYRENGTTSTAVLPAGATFVLDPADLDRLGTFDVQPLDDDENEDDEEGNDNMRPEYFVIGNDTYVEFGPWWYWSVGTPNVTSVVHIGDEVNVTGEIEHDGDITIISAWIIENLTTGEKLTIKGEGAPSWAGGPKAFGIDPWPPY